MYTTYITDALVCGSIDRNTADRSHLLFTRDAGMLWASAKSVREERSKHRYALQDFSHVRVSLVRGKRGWRVTGTESYGNFYTEATDRDTRGYVRDIVRFLRRYLHGEESHSALFDEAVEALASYRTAELGALRTVGVVRMLHLLGYVPAGRYDRIFHASTPAEACVYVDEAARTALERAISRAEEASHL